MSNSIKMVKGHVNIIYYMYHECHESIKLLRNLYIMIFLRHLDYVEISSYSFVVLTLASYIDSEGMTTFTTQVGEHGKDHHRLYAIIKKFIR